MVEVQVKVQAAAINHQAAVLKIQVLKEVAVSLHKRGQTLHTHAVS